jgi:hypothetical protein
MNTHPLHALLATVAPLDQLPTLPPIEPSAIALVRLDTSHRLIDTSIFAQLGWATNHTVLLRRAANTLRARHGVTARAGEVQARLDSRGRLCLPRHLRDALNIRPGDCCLVLTHDDELLIAPSSHLLASLLTTSQANPSQPHVERT